MHHSFFFTATLRNHTTIHHLHHITTSSIRRGHHSSASPTTRWMTKNMKLLRTMLQRTSTTLIPPKEPFSADHCRPPTYCIAYCPPITKEENYTRNGRREKTRIRTHLKWK
ncbi:hypothetical protein LY78DRAFT_118360 [Colletotrichum sublineola]|nr:hypothetical protein LY78DRAFT_118360 [Colletotrichum sublineola]